MIENNIKKHIFIVFCSLTVLFLSACQREDFLVYEENREVRNIGDYIKNNFDLTLFYAALEKTGVIDEISGNETVTIFAPNNAAFQALGVFRVSDFDRLDQDSLKTMLRYHILGYMFQSLDVPLRSIDAKYSNMAGKDLFVAKFKYRFGSSFMYINGSKTLYLDTFLSNGILHVIDACLKYQEGTVQQVLSANNEYSIFTSALKKFGYWEQLSEGSWTIIAPNNDAFIKGGITLQDVESMNPEQFRKRFLGCYLFKVRLFTSDLIVMGLTSGLPIYGGDNLMVPIAGDEEVSSGLLTDMNSGEMTLFLQISGGETTEGLNKVSLVAEQYRNNYFTDNGVVHTVEELLVSKDDAYISGKNE